tara:strand:+ start:1378 stop:1620 length:243 start_codon:yes stop_codon:yes gene_type:complete
MTNFNTVRLLNTFNERMEYRLGYSAFKKQMNVFTHNEDQLEVCEVAIMSYEDDPADSHFQQGFLDAATDEYEKRADPQEH